MENLFEAFNYSDYIMFFDDLKERFGSVLNFYWKAVFYLFPKEKLPGPAFYGFNK